MLKKEFNKEFKQELIQLRKAYSNWSKSENGSREERESKHMYRNILKTIKEKAEDKFKTMSTGYDILSGSFKSYLSVKSPRSTYKVHF